VAVNGLPEGYQSPLPLDPAWKRDFQGTIVKLDTASRWTDQRDPDAGKVPSDPARKAAGLVLDTCLMSINNPVDGGPPWGITMFRHWPDVGNVTFTPAKAFVADVAGAVPGISFMTAPQVCSCLGPKFDMDRFERLYVPDAALSRVRITDSNGNELASLVGKAGDLVMAWPLWVASAGDTFAFWDGPNTRVVSARLEFAATETAALP
jgi:hypothetical protein